MSNARRGRLAGYISVGLIAIGAALFGISVYLAAKGLLVASLVALAAGFASVTSGAEIARKV